jgi:hypothetical protein
MKKTQSIGTELDLAALGYVCGGGIVAGPGDTRYEIHLTPEQIKAIGNFVSAAAHEVVAVSKQIWHAVTSWF